MAIITQGNFTKALWPGVNAWYGKAYDEFKPEWPQLFDKYTSRRAFEEDVGVTGFGLASQKQEGAPITYDTMGQAYTTRYQHVVYASGFIITEEMVDDDLYDVVGKTRAEALAFSMRATKETVAANVYNRAFNSSYTFGDGKEMCSTSHPNVAGGTWSNRLSTDSAISEAALEQACIDLMGFTNDRGLKINVMPDCLIIPPQLVFEAERILKTDKRVGTDANDINAIREMGKFPGGIIVAHYLTSTTAWFIRTKGVPNGLKYFERKGDSFAADNDFDTSNAKFKATGRYSFGVTDPRSIYGTVGA